jgi:Domain of unknown function (DUF4192)
MNLDLHTNAGIIAAIVPILGFPPADSIVILHLRSNTTARLLNFVARYNIDTPVPEVHTFLNGIPLHRDDAVILIAVCAEQLDPAAGAHLDALRTDITNRGIPVLARLRTRQVHTAGHWTDIDTHHSGPTHSYRDSILAAEMAVNNSRAVAPTRADIEREFEPGDPATPITIDNPADLITHTMLGLHAILAGRDDVTTTFAAQTGILITESVHLRDAMLLISNEYPDTAGATWTRIARHLRTQPRIEALALAAACLYTGNDAVRAGIAIDAAHATAEANDLPYSTLAQLLETALRSGISPAQIRLLLANITTTPPLH